MSCGQINFPYIMSTGNNVAGTYCGKCGTKTYLSKDGTHRRCPNCDDR